MDRARRHKPENPPSREGLLDNLVRRGQPGINGGVITRGRRGDEAGDGEPQHAVHRTHPPGWRERDGVGSSPMYHSWEHKCAVPDGACKGGDGLQIRPLAQEAPPTPVVTTGWPL